MATIQCPATVTTSPTGEPLCVDGTSAPVAWVVVPEFELSLLEQPMLSAAFAAGFSIVAIGLLLGKGVKYAISLLK